MSINKIDKIMNKINLNELSFKYKTNNVEYDVQIVLPSNNIEIPYILGIPNTIEEDYAMILETNNLEKEDQIELIKDGLYRGINLVNIFNDCKAPIIIPILPSAINKKPYYQQLATECFLETASYQRIDEQIIKIIEASKKTIFDKTNIAGQNKIFINGYSTSGVFAQRFCLIHPEIIKVACIGGASGSIPIPTMDFNYPIGVLDYNEIFKKDFNLEAYKQIKFRYYVGELEGIQKSSNRYTDDHKNAPIHDMSYMERSTPMLVGKRLRETFGENIIERSNKQIEYLNNMGIDITQHIIQGRSHSDSLGHGVNELGDYYINKVYNEQKEIQKSIKAKL